MTRILSLPDDGVSDLVEVVDDEEHTEPGDSLPWVGTCEYNRARGEAARSRSRELIARFVFSRGVL